MEVGNVRKYLKERSFVPNEEYDIVRGRSARSCHDAIIYMPDEGKILLSIRSQEPAKNLLWPFGGGQKLGYFLEESAKKVIGKESGLILEDIEFFGKPVDHIWSSGPKGKPVHDVGNYYTVIGRGEIRLDKLHSARLITPEEYFDEKERLPHWTRVGMDCALERFFSIGIGDKTPFPKYYIDAQPFFE